MAGVVSQAAKQPRLQALAAADACAEEEVVGIGGWAVAASQMVWFAETWTMQDVRRVWPCLVKPAQRYIACFETLAQLALLQATHSHIGGGRYSFSTVSGIDNSAAEAGINKLFTTSWPLQVFVQLVASLGACQKRPSATDSPARALQRLGRQALSVQALAARACLMCMNLCCPLFVHDQLNRDIKSENHVEFVFGSGLCFSGF